MRDLGAIVARLARARADLESVARTVAADRWTTRPHDDAWSAAEVIAHLTMVEETIASGADRLLRGAPPRVPLWKRIHAPVWLAEWRGLKVKTPIPLDPLLVGEKEAMLARLANSRRRTLALLEENRGRNLSAFRWPHPYFRQPEHLSVV